MVAATHRQVIALALGATVLVSCGGAQKSPSQRSSLTTETASVRRFESPARWQYHPRKSQELATKLKLPANNALFAGHGGERWLFNAKEERVVAASQLADEPLISILALQDDRWLFVGTSGTGYEADSPLGPFTRSSPPSDPLSQVSAAGSSIAGIRFDGALVQTTDAGLTWQTVTFPKTFFADVELAQSNFGVAFSIPEAWYITRDNGQHWALLDVPPIGVIELKQDPKAGIVALGATGWYDVDPKRPGLFSKRSVGPSDQGFKLPLEPPRGPDAAALAEHRGLLLGDRYLEVQSDPEHRNDWLLLSGKLGEALDSEPLEFLKGCHAVRLAGYEAWLYAACFESKPDEVAVPLMLHASRDGGKTFKEEPFSVRAKLDEFAIAVGAEGRLVITGICSPQDSSRGCAPHGVFHKRRKATQEKKPEPPKKSKQQGKRAKAKKKTNTSIALSAVPGLASTPMAMTFSADGKVAYLVGQRTKSDNYTMFVSTDQGETFRAREIEQLGAKPRSTSRRPWYRREKVADAVLDMRASEDGTLSVVIRRGEQVALAVTDDDGRVLSLTPGPGESSTMGAFGTRAVALSPHTGKAWETLDGGVSWEPIGSAPVALCEKNQECDVPIRCGAVGCVVGDTLTRVGWRGQQDAEQDLHGPPESLSTGLLYPRVRTPISCTLDDGEWAPLKGSGEAPSAHEAAIGDTVWHLHGSDPNTAAAWGYHGYGGKRPRVNQVTLFPAANGPEQMAFAMFDQIEGASALRYRLPRAGSREITGVEVAWDNRFENVVKRAPLGKSLELQSGDYSTQRAKTQLAMPDIVSVGVGGVYLRLHRRLGDAQPTYFFDGRRVTTIPPVDWPATSTSWRTEMVHSGGAHLPIRLQGSGATLARASAAGTGWQFDSMTLGLPFPKRLEQAQLTGITYWQGGSGFYVLSFAASGRPRRGQLFPLQATGTIAGPPIDVPQQLDLADPPAPCTDAERQNSPRVVTPYQAGTRHPIIISHRIEPIRTLLSDGAVLHGTPNAPCMAALSAVPIDMDDRDDRTWMHAIIAPNDLEQAWAFRVVYDEDGDKQVSYRNMKCEFDPKAAVPKRAFSEPGTLSSEP